MKPNSPPVTERCPFIDLDDPRCSNRFTLDRLTEAFELCLDRYQSCPTYYKLLDRNPGLQLIHVTAHGRSLQRTGS